MLNFMTQLELDIRKWILKAILAANRPMPEGVLKMSIRSAFTNVAFTDGDMDGHIRSAESAGLIGGTTDDVSGRVWDLTPKGRIPAQRL
jgi:hypothetical protein